jgi:hypothetical protein
MTTPLDPTSSVGERWLVPDLIAPGLLTVIGGWSCDWLTIPLLHLCAAAARPGSTWLGRSVVPHALHLETDERAVHVRREIATLGARDRQPPRDDCGSTFHCREVPTLGDEWAAVLVRLRHRLLRGEIQTVLLDMPFSFTIAEHEQGGRALRPLLPRLRDLCQYGAVVCTSYNPTDDGQFAPDSALLAAADVAWSVIKSRDGNSAHREWTMEKNVVHPVRKPETYLATTQGVMLRGGRPYREPRRTPGPYVGLF